MVATSGSGWVLAPCLVTLVAETNRLFPQRSIGSDGSIGDLAHASRESDHNPSGGYVHAIDLTDDDTHRCDVTILLTNLVATKDRRIKYLIHKGTIWRSYATSGLPAWTPDVYTGINAHLKHLHVSVLDDQVNATGPWWPVAPTPTLSLEDEMQATLSWLSNGGSAALYLCAGATATWVNGADAIAIATVRGAKADSSTDKKPHGKAFLRQITILDGPLLGTSKKV